MRLGFKLFILVIFINFYSLYAQDSDDYDLNNESEIGGLNGTDYDSDEDADDETCSADAIIEQFSSMIMPDDYEEGKQNIKDHFESFNQTLEAMLRLQQYSNNVSEKMSEFNKRISSRLTEVLMTLDLPSECMTSLARIMNGVQNGDLWALKLVDVSGPPYGNYDECLSIESPPEPEQPVIHGRYCYMDAGFIRNFRKEEFDAHQLPDRDKALASLPINGFNLFKQITGKLYEPISLRNETRHMHKSIDVVDYMFPRDIKLLGGYCIPSTCKPEDLSRAINQIIYPITRMPIKLHPDCNYVGKPIKLDKYQWISLSILLSTVGITVLCSFIDILPERWMVTKIIDNAVRHTSIDSIITCFSAKRNLKAIFNMRQTKLKAFDGMRAFLSVWIVLCHTYETGFLIYHVRNFFISAPYKMSMNYRNMFVPNILLMDNFMFISSFLLMSTLMAKLDQTKGRFNYIQFILFRYLRMLPIMVVGITISFLFEFIGDGPFWGNVKLFIADPCYTQWYKPLLMISNFFPYVSDNTTMISPLMCVNVSWYAAADFQLYALSPIAFLLLFKRPKLGFIWNLILLAFGMSVVPFTVYYLEIPHIWPAFRTNIIENVQLSWQRHYWGAQSYIQTYIIGFLMAYAVKRHPKVNLGGRIGESAIWLVTVSTTFGLLWWQKDFLNFEYKYEGLFGYEAHVYYTFGKVLYLSGFCWLFYACATGRAPLINDIMGWKVFKVVGNLLIEIYVLHLFVVIYRMGTLREQVTYTDHYILTAVVFDFIVSLLVSILCGVFVTKPFGELTMLLVRKPQPRRPKRTTSVQSPQLKIDITNDTKPSDMNNNGSIDGVNGFTNPGLKDIDLKVLDSKLN